MASKRGTSAAPKAAASSPAVQTPQQKAKTPPPSPPPYITLKDLQDSLAQLSKQMTQQITQQIIQQMRVETEELLVKKNDELCENLSQIFQGFASHVDRIDERIDEVGEKMEGMEERMEERMGKVEEEMQIAQNDIVMSQFREMEHAIRIRGLKEDLQEKLKEEVSAALALVFDCAPEIIFGEIEKIYRVNSWVARQKNQPRDVVVYFFRKTRRNEIIQAFYHQRFQIAAQDVILLKEVPSKILRKRKEFAFLAQELKKRQLSFRWEIPVGMVLSYAGNRYKLDTVQKAREFYLTVLKADSSPTPLTKGAEEIVEQLIVDLSSATSMPAVEFQSQQLLELKDVKEQRMTRAAYRRKEREQQKEIVPITYSPTSEAVGGARPKRPVTADLHGMLQKFQKPKDG